MFGTFYMDDRQVKALRRLYEVAPRKFRQVSAGVLNGFAFDVRKEAVSILKKNLIVRDSNFLRASMRYGKTKASMSLSSQVSWAGSVEVERSTGWKEQYTGHTSKTRFPTKRARLRGKRSRVQDMYRLKPGRKLWKSNEFGGARARTEKQKEMRMMAILSKMHGPGAQLFELSGKGVKAKRGIYALLGTTKQDGPNAIRQISYVQALDERKRIKKVQWLDMAIKARINSRIVELKYEQALNRYVFKSK